MLSPLAIGLLLHAEALGGFLVGVNLSGQLLAVFMASSGSAWNTFLTWCGFALRNNRSTVLRYSPVIDIAVIILLAALVALYVVRHLVRRA